MQGSQDDGQGGYQVVTRWSGSVSDCVIERRKGIGGSCLFFSSGKGMDGRSCKDGDGAAMRRAVIARRLIQARRVENG